MKALLSLMLVIFFLVQESQAGLFDWLFGPSPNPSHKLVVQEIGGSNYVFWNVGDYIGSWTEEAWRKPGNLKPVIGRFHENPQVVQEHLHRMYLQGQRKIAIMIWFSVFSEEFKDEDVLHHMINANAGRLPEQQEENLRNFLKLATQIGFKEIQVRFAQQWLSDPSSWQAELQFYAQNASFIFSTREIVEEELAPLGITRIYDLGAELGGLYSHNHRFNPLYTQRLWTDYVRHYGAEDTVGFSYAMAPGRVGYQYEIYKSVGVFPKYVALDVYGSHRQLFSSFLTAFEEIKVHGQEATPFIIQEAYYNDVVTLMALKDAQSINGMNVKTVMQWPLSRRGAEELGAKHITEQFPEYFFNYLGVGNPFVQYAQIPH